MRPMDGLALLIGVVLGLVVVQVWALDGWLWAAGLALEYGLIFGIAHYLQWRHNNHRDER